jgi:hypothetical protein
MEFDKYEKLKKLKTLLDDGLLNQDEFDKLKNEILFEEAKTKNLKEKIDNSIKINNETNNVKELLTNRNNSKKSNLKYYLLIIIIAIGIFIKSYVPAEQREILALYPDSKQFLKIRKTSWILVTNSSNKSNVYDTNSKRFLLSKWYKAKYDEGVFFDDITFDFDNKSKMCSESNYHYLTEKGDEYLNSSLGDYNPNYRNSPSTNSGYLSEKKCSWCGKSFRGEHYTHLGKISDCYSTSSTTSIGIYCSMSCCSQARRSSCPTCR